MHSERAHSERRTQLFSRPSGLPPGRRLWTYAALMGSVLLPVCLLGNAVGVAQAEGVQKPPSSLKPGNRAGTIELTHERRRVESCELTQEEGEPVCRPKVMKPEKSGTKVTLKPIGASGKVVAGDTRRKQTIEFSAKKGRQVKNLTLAPGVWELSWVQGGAAKDRFRVEPGDDFHIGLESFKGACSLAGKACKLSKSKGRKSIEIPVDRVLE